MTNRKLAVTVAVAGTILLAACNPITGGGGNMIDVRPIGSGMEFLGYAVVLASLILTFGRFIGK